MSQPTAILLLEDGTIYHGRSIGSVGTTVGELCFNTGMTGYQEIFTDPSYFGQILINSHVLIGNYGARYQDMESDCCMISGLIVRDFSHKQYRYLADETLQEFMMRQGLVGIEGLDTRSLVRKVRQNGAMNALISSEDVPVEKLKARLHAAPAMDGLELSSQVTTAKIYDIGDPDAAIRIAALDFGIKRSILNCLTSRGCLVRVYPANTSMSEMEAWHPHGYFLSNGPGDPAAMPYAVETIRQIMTKNKPIFGICLGHQLLALAMGIKTYKLHHGHRGINHPVINMETGLCEITSQNHGFGVHVDAFKGHESQVRITHVNLNDGTVEGLRLVNYPAFSVQYHPEASPGPHDARYLFDDFIHLVQSHVDSSLSSSFHQ